MEPLKRICTLIQYICLRIVTLVLICASAKNIQTAPQGIRGQMLMCLIGCVIHWTPRHDRRGKKEKNKLFSSCHFKFSLTVRNLFGAHKNYRMSHSLSGSFAN